MADEFVHHGAYLHKPLDPDSIGIQLHQSFARAPPQKAAIINAVTGEKITYRALLNVTCRLAEALKNAGYRKDDVISVCGENSLEFFQPVIAAFYLGIVVSPINHGYVEDEIMHIASLTRPKIVFCSKSVVSNYVRVKRRCDAIERVVVLNSKERIDGTETLEEFIGGHCDKYFDEYSFKPTPLDSKEQLAVVLCSSGTTGLPKGVMTTHENISVKINHSHDPSQYEINPDARMLGFLPFFHGFGFMTAISSLVMGHTIIVLPKFTDHSFLAAIQDYKIEDLWIVPPIMVFLAKSPLVDKFDLTSLKSIVCGAAPLSNELQNQVLRRLNLKYIRQGYGLTETTLAVLLSSPGITRSGSSGKVVPGMQCKVRDPETGRTLGPNEVGELCFKGGLVMKGYFRNPKATKDTFQDGWLLTGDLGYFDREGYFYIVDRLKELIKYKGFQVAPAELEAILLSHPKINDAGVVGMPDDKAGEVPVAFVVPKANAQITEKEIIDFVSEHVSHTKRLHGGVKFVEFIPKTAAGKILRRELKKLVKNFVSKL